jgi:myo-inositol-1(or 4)-monophosphatase
LAVARSLALEAGALLRDLWRSSHEVYSKGYRNIVTEADFAAETLILGGLRKTYPDHAITSEEAGADVGTQQVRWLVDPLDGTTNFAHHNPNFCVSIAALRGNEPEVGVIYDPLREHLFTAVRGGGATFNDAPLRTSGLKELEDALFAVDWPRTPELREELGELVALALAHTRTQRNLGSAALNMAYVAAGWLDLYFAAQLSAWDQGAAVLMVREAGGGVGTLSGAPWKPGSFDPLLASTPQLFDAFVALREKGSL